MVKKSINVKCMAYVSSGKNCFRWPAKDDILTYGLEDIIAVIDPPVPINQCHFRINENQFADLQQKHRML